MKKMDTFSGAFWLLFSILMVVESIRLGLGSYHDPGAGSFPFLIGLVFGFLSLILIIASVKKSREGEGTEASAEISWTRITIVIAAMFLYAYFLERLGFLISTFLFITALLISIGKKQWHIAMGVAGLISVAAYAVFELWLHSQLPKGVFGI